MAPAGLADATTLGVWLGLKRFGREADRSRKLKGTSFR
jgi:hypothetical protein